MSVGTRSAARSTNSGRTSPSWTSARRRTARENLKGKRFALPRAHDHGRQHEDGQLRVGKQLVKGLLRKDHVGEAGEHEMDAQAGHKGLGEVFVELVSRCAFLMQPITSSRPWNSMPGHCSCRHRNARAKFRYGSTMN